MVGYSEYVQFWLAWFVALLTFLMAQHASGQEFPPLPNDIEVASGRSKTFQMPWLATDVAVAEPSIADIQLLSDPEYIRVVGRSSGITDITVLGPDGEARTSVVRVFDATAYERAEQQREMRRRQREAAERRASEQVQELQNTLNAFFPNGNIHVSRAGTVISVQGTLPDVNQAEALGRFMTEWQESTVIPRALLDPEGEWEGTLGAAGAPDQTTVTQTGPGGMQTSETTTAQPRNEDLRWRIVNMVSIGGVQQVQIQVRVAEVSRTAIRTLGINAFKTGSDFFAISNVGSAAGGALNPTSIGVLEGATAGNDLPFVFTQDANVSPLTTLVAGFPNSDLQFFIQALAENQYLRVLAEPTLVALSGETATFLAGGEFPIPVPQGVESDTITIEYKKFGVELAFKPIVLGDNKIRMEVRPEVSDISDIGAVQFAGFRIPSVVTRRAESTVEMRSGQTFAMAGLLEENAIARNSRVPYLGDIPILGSLFRSTRYEEGETELVILVTPNIVQPMNVVDPGPMIGEGHIVPDDFELYMEGRLEDRESPEDLWEESPFLVQEGLADLYGPRTWVGSEEVYAYPQGNAQ